MFLKKFYKLLLDILFPIECIGCKKEEVWICKECLEKIEINKKGLQKPDVFPSELDGFFVASSRKDKILEEMIEKFKYRFSQELSEPLSKLLIKKVEWIFENSLLNENLLIIAVPLHKKRYNWRGFNQAELLCKKVCKKIDLEFDNNLVKRIKNTKSQAKQKNKKEREENIKDAFEIMKNVNISVKNVLLIDDVITTGATMSEIAKVLKKNGVLKVYGLVLSRG